MAKYQVIAQPRNSLPTDSWEFAVQTLLLLKTGYEHASISYEHFERTLEEAKEYRIFERLPDPEHPYGNLEAMLQAEISANEDEAKKRKLEGHGGDRKSPKFQGVTNTLMRGSTNAAYLEARIARDRPDILERMKAGEYRSVNAAAMDAGIIEKRIEIPVHPERAARIIQKYFTEEQVVELTDYLRFA